MRSLGLQRYRRLQKYIACVELSMISKGDIVKNSLGRGAFGSKTILEFG